MWWRIGYALTTSICFIIGYALTGLPVDEFLIFAGLGVGTGNFFIYPLLFEPIKKIG